MMQVTDGSPYLHENPYLYESLTTVQWALWNIFLRVKSAHMPPDQAGNDSGGTKSQQCVMERTVYIESTFDAIDDLRTVGKKMTE